MEQEFRCPRCGFANPVITGVSQALLAISGELRVGSILQKLVDAARDLGGARYAALGIPHEEGGFAQFIASGLTDAETEAIGRLPRTHGLLGELLERPVAIRTPNLRADERWGGWPDAHPEMTSFLGVPILSDGHIVGAFYLADKQGAPAFTAADQEAIELLASHAIIAIENARLYERSRELSVVEERNRLARELHDSVSQTLFSVVLTAEAAATLMRRDPDEAREQIVKLQELTRGALAEMRSLIFELRPAELDRDGLVPTLRKHIEVLRRVFPADVSLEVDGERRLGARTEKELYRIAQEALHNALKHAQAKTVCVRVTMTPEAVSVCVRDDGRGFDPDAPDVRSKSLGLTSMEERAASIGASLRLESACGSGTAITVEVHGGGS